MMEEENPSLVFGQKAKESNDPSLCSRCSLQKNCRPHALQAPQASFKLQLNAHLYTCIPWAGDGLPGSHYTQEIALCGLRYPSDRNLCGCEVLKHVCSYRPLFPSPCFHGSRCDPANALQTFLGSSVVDLWGTVLQYDRARNPTCSWCPEPMMKQGLVLAQLEESCAHVFDM